MRDAATEACLRVGFGLAMVFAGACMVLSAPACMVRGLLRRIPRQ